jgi:hypothetical protein
MASAPQFIGSVARQRGCPPPPHSSVNSTLVPALLKVGGMPEGVVRIAHGVDADGIHRVGISSRIPLPEHAPPPGRWPNRP